MGAQSAGAAADDEPEGVELAAVDDALQRLVQAAATLEELRQRQLSVSRARDAAMAELHDQGLSYAEIAQIAGTTRGRVAQIVQRHRTETASPR